MDLKKVQKVLVFQTAFLGDAILCIPLLKNLRALMPQAKIGFVCRSGVADLFRDMPAVVDQVFEVNKKNRKSLKSTFEETKIFAADLILSPHRSFRTAFWVSQLRAPTKIGFRDPWTFFAYNVCVPRPAEKHDVLRQLSLMQGVMKAAQGQDFNMDIFDSETLPLKTELKTKAPLKYQGAVALSPGSQWNTKRWTKSGYAEVAAHYLSLGETVLLLGTKDERALGDEIAKDLNSARGKLINLCGETSVLELAQIVGQAKLLVCNDSGTMHIATLMGTPVVSIFGPTVPRQGYAPWSVNSKVVQVDLPCRPCGAHGHQKCPIKTHACMTGVKSEVVLQNADSLSPKEAGG